MLLTPSTMNESLVRFQSNFSNNSFPVKVKNKYSRTAEIDCGVPQGSIFGPARFLLYVNDMKQVVDCDLFLYADYSCLAYQPNDVNKIEQSLNKKFSEYL